jgi:hypothetical protein
LAGAFARAAAVLLVEPDYGGGVDSAHETLIHSVGTRVQAAVRAAVHEAVASLILHVVYDPLYEALYDTVGVSLVCSLPYFLDDLVLAATRQAVGVPGNAVVNEPRLAAIFTSTHEAVRRCSMSDSVREALLASVLASVGAAADLSMDATELAALSTPGVVDPAAQRDYGSRVLPGWHDFMGEQFWAMGDFKTWRSPSMLSYLRDVCGLSFGADAELVDAIIVLGESCCMWWPLRNFALVCDRPSVIVLDEEGRPHNESGLAIEFRDGWGVHAIHGEISKTSARADR